MLATWLRPALWVVIGWAWPARLEWSWGPGRTPWQRGRSRRQCRVSFRAAACPSFGVWHGRQFFKLAGRCLVAVGKGPPAKCGGLTLLKHFCVLQGILPFGAQTACSYFVSICQLIDHASTASQSPKQWSPPEETVSVSLLCEHILQSGFLDLNTLLQEGHPSAQRRPAFRTCCLWPHACPQAQRFLKT